MDIFNQLKSKLKEYGAECRIVSANHIPEMETEIDKLYKDSLINEEIYKKYVERYFDFSIATNPQIRSLIIIATPSPQINVRFNVNGASYMLKVPPVYSDKKIVTGFIKEITTQLFDGNGYNTIPIVLPKKLLAAHSGLAKFGKNNISYVTDMGSYHRITVFGSDILCPNDSWQEIQMLERCESCSICFKNCPTGAIRKDRFVVQAERCLTYFNEQVNPFPEWIDYSWHNSIIGCMRCQSVCPENKKYTSAKEYHDEFSEIETRFILNGIAFKNLPEELQVKLKNLCFEPCYVQVSRNLNVLLNMS
jgi:epoxyqueuosine reductase